MSTEKNKEVVLRFNKEFLEKNNTEVLKEIVADDFINHTAAANIPNDVNGLIQFVAMLHKVFSEIHIEIFEQVAESDLVATRKEIYAKHTGEIMGRASTGKSVTLNVIDMIRLRDGKYIEHWGRNDFMQVIQSL
jgi:predicted SnoaL-like aldol condensation-catalyzing enzyme